MIISANALSKAYGADTVLENVSFSIEEGEKVAFVGVNGAGKTTIFKMITGEIAPDGGEIIMAKNAVVSYLAQNTEYESGLTVYDEMLTAFTDVIEAEKRLRELEIRMAEIAGDGSVMPKLAEEYDELVRFYEGNDGYSYKSLIRGVIVGLSLSEADVSGKKISELSGGQKTRAALGKALLKKPDILLLDEPTNHLDVETVSWLENYLKSYGKTVLLISHDRFFMDSVVSRVIEINEGKAAVYKGNYTEFITRRGMNDELARKQYKDAMKEIKKQEESARLLRSFNRQKTVKRAESIEKRLAKAAPPERLRERAEINIRLTPKIESGFDVLTVSDITKSYGSNTVLSGVSLDLKRGERAALIGANGIGKTTLLKLILNETRPDSGNIRLGVNALVGAYDQERQNLTDSKTVFSQIHDAYPKLTEGEVRSLLAALLFRGDDVFKSISALSGGERGRVSLALLMLSGANFLLLDEPTNHLDTYSKEILENALLEYGGTFLCVSHDRYFINKTATRILELTKSGIKSYSGNYDYYLQKKSEELYNTETEAPADNNRKEAVSGWQERKAEAAAARKKAAAISRIEHEIAETESKIKELDERLCSSEIFSDHVLANAVHEEKTLLEASLEELYADWEDAHEAEDLK